MRSRADRYSALAITLPLVGIAVFMVGSLWVPWAWLLPVPLIGFYAQHSLGNYSRRLRRMGYVEEFRVLFNKPHPIWDDQGNERAESAS